MVTNPGNLRSLQGLRRSMPLVPGSLVKTNTLLPGRNLPLSIEPNVRDMDLELWAARERASLSTLLLRHGAILFRGFRIAGIPKFQSIVQSIVGDLLEYKEQTSPRSKVAGNVYTSTEYPPHQCIFLHNENSYSSLWPRKIMFFCVTPPDSGGETPIADVRRVLTRIPLSVRERFEQLGWMLVRNFGTGYGLSWQTAFQTEDPAEVNRYCMLNAIEHEWITPQRLRMKQRRRAILPHPDTGENVWFNHTAFFHHSTLDAEIRNSLASELAEEDLPYNTFYGDGSRIEVADLDTIRDAYEQETVAFAWQRNDLLLLDNMLAAHGRSSYDGPRKIVVAMTEPYAGPSGE